MTAAVLEVGGCSNGAGLLDKYEVRRSAGECKPVVHFFQ